MKEFIDQFIDMKDKQELWFTLQFQKLDGWLV